ncbi:hypothetical protein L227DRAFT_607121 [Lentinus tigrinus ALCF2SS1-6]|uniref:Uncharacterized protein n=1 Tax=Lentinus tigrinus ALCF2SS1-6 TaxID=1328759 RepID=A0A5C2SPA0_9APHY|nr:hypothetical protein L227DRAFT_607121 [Lentinus tigrinus ALCF2SS1-6]
MSYYREHVSFPNVAAGPYPPDLVAELERNAAARAALLSGGRAADGDDPDTRTCSVKGCSAQLPAGYTNKMCEECRGRHRVYAMTKRAKRKMEKALLNGSAAQNGQVVWMPQDEGAQHEHEQPVAGPSRQFEDPHVQDENLPHFDFPAEWDPQAIDPRLFSQASELAGALTLPGTVLQHVTGREVFARNDHQPQQLPQESPHHSPQQPPPSHTRSPSAAPPPPTAPEIHPILAEVLKAVPNFNLSTRVTSGPTVDTPGSSEGPLPPRFCSIKGCKTLIAGNSFFKMCEPCRDRYRSYGTTKRAKWRREKEAAVQELHKLRSEEDARRAAEGLPPLPPPEEETWHEYSPPATDGPSLHPAGSPSGSGTPAPVPAPAEGQDPNAPLPPRMCTVSHCREILPGDYQFLRCERHRIQNRHHSKLKRVRDKEVKAQVHDDWAAAVGAQLAGGSAGEEGTEDVSVPDVALSATDIAQVFGELEKELRDGSLGPEFTGVVAEAGVDVDTTQQSEDTPLGEPSTGVPPAARGTRRTNHVCSIKTCANLLSPSNPWKMCDLCRSRDRASRRLKALRDSGLIPPEVAAGKIVEMKMEVEGRGEVKGKGEKKDKKEKGGKKKKKKGKKGDDAPATEATVPAQADETVASGSASGSGSTAESEIVQQPADTAENPNPSIDVDMSDGAIDPSALHHTTPATESQSSVFNNANLIFMEPIFGELASTLRHFAQLTGSDSPSATAEPMQSTDVPQGDVAEPSSPKQDVPTVTAPPTPAAPPSPKKKGSKGKGKAKASSQPNGDVPAGSAQQQAGEVPQPVDTVAHEANASNPVTAPAANEDPSQHPPPPYPPPPNGYPYYMPPPYMPYGQPLGYQYGYPPPPPTPGKGPSGQPPPPPPMYQHPYGPYPPYAYAYPGQPYPYPGYMPPPPPPGQSYSPPPPAPQQYSPPPQPYPPPEQSQQQAGQPYAPGPQIQPYPYAHPYPPPPPPPQVQQPQPQPVPPPEPEPEPEPESESPAAMYMTFSSNPKPKTPPGSNTTTFRVGTNSPPSVTASTTPATASNHLTKEAPPAPTAPSGPRDGRDKDKSPRQLGQRRNTFIVRTSETYESPPATTNRPMYALKRRRDEDYYDLVQNKRTVQDGSGYSMFQVSLSNPPAQSGSATPNPSPQLAQAQVPPAAAVADTDMLNKVQCSHKNCKRVLPSGTTVSLCERCRERLKKKQAKAKHRFKLEPKTLLRRSSGDGSVPVGARA